MSRGPEVNASATPASNSSVAAAWHAHSAYLLRVANRLLGDAAYAEDTVQEAFARLAQVDVAAIDDVRGWLAVVVRRLSIDRLRSAYLRHETAAEVGPDGEVPAAGLAPDPSDRVTLDDEVQLALGVVLDELSPPERTAFVLHDVFAVPFDEIGPLVGRSPTAARQLASRARRTVQGKAPLPGRDRARDRAVVAAFLAAAHAGDLDTLVVLLDPEARFSADGTAARHGFPRELLGGDRLAQAFRGRTKGAQLALIDGEVGVAWAPGGKAQGLFAFTVVDDAIVAIALTADATRAAALHVALLGG
jgi:RNA polymerase sigma-70 factor, ECF subfamily